jgi:hypothetical protein
MRYLNKIIFINSANIPYAEVMLDGNVHFSGTQGVGKSTVLRALLFFYNADKLHLGIQQGQKTFEEFYFRHSNSYMVYEVKTDLGSYSVLLSRSHGRIAYRFIDAAYRRDWLVGDDGRVESDWIRIRERIDANVDISEKIDTYDDYRNIIFGNKHDRAHRYDKYAIVESSRYQNIPRSIQNVFLNSKLDADFVKNTIIQSMTDSEDVINLQTFRRLVSDFEREFDEIDCWYRKEKSGDVVVRVKAGRVVENFRLLNALELEMKQTWRQLNFAHKQAQEEAPLVEDEIRDLQEKMKKIVEKIDGLKRDYEKDHEKILREIQTRHLRLTDINNKRKRYAELKIDDIMAFNAQEPVFRTELTQREQRLATLQEQYKDVAEKYKKLYSGLETEWNLFGLAQKEEMFRCNDAVTKEIQNLMAIRDKRKKEIDVANDAWMKESDERMNTLQGELNRTEKHLVEVRYWHPFSKEIESAKEDVRQLRSREGELKRDYDMAHRDLESLRREGDMKRGQIEKESVVRVDRSKEELEAMKSELALTESMLTRWTGSLYEWLAENKPGWENNIGKVVDEQQVLYAQGLAPELSAGGNLFGVNINLDAIPVHHRTPDDYRVLRKQQTEAVEGKKKEIDALMAERNKAIDDLKKAYHGKIAQKQQEEINLRSQWEQMPLRIKDAETRLHKLERDERAKIEEESERRSKLYNKALLNRDSEQTDREQQRKKREKELKSADADYNSARRKLEERVEELRQKQRAESLAKRESLYKQRVDYERQERDELRGYGADTNAIDACRREIEDAKAKIAKIESNRRYVIEYQKDQEELLSHEAEFRSEKLMYETKDAQIRQNYDDKNRRLENERRENSVLQMDSKEKLQRMEEGIKQYNNLVRVENDIPEQLTLDGEMEKSALSCGELVEQMRGVLTRRRRKRDELKTSVNSFNSHFKDGNIFHFVTPQVDSDYMEYAYNLMDFVENDKIDDFRLRVSDHYKNILQNISREVGMLMNHSAEIRSIINEVNRDFRERNFAGVIRSIELRSEESSDRMMNLLCSIRNFVVENALSIGELNLFSGAERDNVNMKAVAQLKSLMHQLQKEPSRTTVTISDTFRLQFCIQENDNNTGWVERINNVGSDGTDILVKAMVNIMLINVFKTRASRKGGDFIIHCMMDEIGKLHPNNVAGILQFANVRNIYLINSSPMGYNADIYKYNYLLMKDAKSQTHIKRLITNNI